MMIFGKPKTSAAMTAYMLTGGRSVGHYGAGAATKGVCIV